MCSMAPKSREWVGRPACTAMNIGDHALEDGGGGLTQDLGADDVEQRAQNGEDEHDDQL